MAWLNNYREYLKDNPQHYWFKRKLYGWGWTPVRWQGWVTILVYVLLVIPFSLKFGEKPRFFFVVLFILTIFLLLVCYKKGEKPRWQWGRTISKE